MTRFVLVSALLSFLPLLQAEVVARSCDRQQPESCQYLITDKGWVKQGHSTSADEARVREPYLGEYQHLVSSDEAPVRVLVSLNDWRVVITLGFEKEYRFAGPIYYFYFFDKRGTLAAKIPGDLLLESARIGTIFGTPTNLFVAGMRGEVSDSQTTTAWVLPEAGPLSMALEDANGDVSEVVDEPPGLILVEMNRETHSAKNVFWRWDERTGKFLRN